MGPFSYPERWENGMRLAACKHCRLAFEVKNNKNKFCGECDPKRVNITIFRKGGYRVAQNYPKN